MSCRFTPAPAVWRFLLALAVLFLGPGAAHSAQAEGQIPNPFARTNLIIISTNRSDFSTVSWVSRGDVRVSDSQMYMECELLTVWLQTNNAAPAGRNRTPPPAVGSSTNIDARIDRIIAETNVLIMTKEVTLIGDRAVYTQSNEVVVVTGELVIAETEKSYTYGTQFEFDLRTSQGSILGPHIMELKVGVTPGGSNAPRPNLIERRPRPGTSPKEGKREK
jgi:hypothetical protein